MSKDTHPCAGLRHSARLTVEPRHTAPQIAADWPGFVSMPPVLATGILIAFIEHTCVRALDGHLNPGEQTVGVRTDISHRAPTLVGQVVLTEVELIAVNERSMRFAVSCRDEDGAVGEGIHDRAMIRSTVLQKRLDEKLSRFRAAPSREQRRPKAMHMDPDAKDPASSDSD